MKYLKIISLIVYFAIILLSFVLYSEISKVVPVIRGLTIEKTLFWGTRIQFINLISFLAILILGNSILRYEEFKKSKVVVFTLFLTILSKGIIEFLALFYNVLLINSAFILIPIVILGLAIALYNSKYIFADNRWKNIKFNLIEKIFLSIIGLAYIVLNLPILTLLIINK